MTFAENNRISHRQLYRQLVLTFTAPFLLCLFQGRRLNGVMGILGSVLAAVILLFYVIFLIRIAPRFDNMRKTAGSFFSIIIGIFFETYTILCAAYLISVLMQIVPESLLEGVPPIWIGILAVLVCSYKSSCGMQGRGRVAEVSAGILILVILLMMALSLGQAKLVYFQEMLSRSSRSLESLWGNMYGLLCAFSGIGLLPFLLKYVEKPRSAWKPAALGIISVIWILEGMLMLFPAVFGWDRLRSEEMPILPLLSGTNLPGQVLARFDVLWMSFVLYGLLFSVGSLFQYSHLIYQAATGRKSSRWITLLLSLLVLGLSAAEYEGKGIQDYFLKYLGAVFVPGLLIIQFILAFMKKEKRKKHILAMSLLVFALGTSGCAGIEPEKRMYPLAMGIQSENGNLICSYGMPDLQKTTGQKKEEEGKTDLVLTLQGESLEDIEKEYYELQEKHLDLGHLEVLILEEKILENDDWKKVLTYLKKERMVGENIYVFTAENAREVIEWQLDSGTNAGEYLTGILENKHYPEKQNGKTLRQIYHDWYQKDRLSGIPFVTVEENTLCIKM